MPIHEPTGAWTTQHTYTTSNCTSECVCKCGLRIVIIACWFYSFFFFFSFLLQFDCSLVPVSLSLSPPSVLIRLSKLHIKDFTSRSLCSHIHILILRLKQFISIFWTGCEKCAENLLSFILYLFSLFSLFSHKQTRTNFAHFSLTHSHSLALRTLTLAHSLLHSHCMVGLLAGWLFEPLLFTFLFFFSFALRLIIALKAPRSYEFSHTTQQRLLGESARGKKRTQKSVDEMKTRLVPVCFMACILFSRLSNCRGDH